jgi:hypothetical protein
MKKKSISVALASFLTVGGIFVNPPFSVKANSMTNVSVSIVNQTSVATPFTGFKDVSSDYAFYEEIEFLKAKHIIGGFPEGIFKPDLPITRAQAAIMIGRTLGLNGEPMDTKFSDVTKKVSGSGYIAAVVEKGIIDGLPDNTFRPNQRVSREQIAIFLNRAFKLPYYYSNYLASKYSDIGYGYMEEKSRQAIINVIGNRIIDGYSDETFRPYEYVTRGQFSSFLARTLEPSFRVFPTFAVDSIVDEETGTPNIDIDRNNSWVIKFSNKVDWTSLRDNIYIVRESDNYQFTPNIYYDQRSSTVKLQLGELYEPNETYYLYITKNVKSKSGSPLAEPILIKFHPVKLELNMKKSLVQKGIQYEVQTEQSDGKVFLNVTATNISGETIPYFGHNGCDRGIDAELFAETENGPVQVSGRDPARSNFPEVCTQNIPEYTLEPGASVKIVKVFYPSAQQINGKKFIKVTLKTFDSIVIPIPLQR